MAERGVVDAETLVWREGWDQWRAVREVEALRGFIAASRPTTGRSAPAHPSPPAGFAASPPDLAALRLCALRFAAAIIDQLILFVPTLAVLTPLLIVMIGRGMTPDRLQQLTPADPEWWFLFLGVWVTQWVYASLTESSALMGTVGKRVCGLRVVDGSARRLTFARASARYWSKVLSTPFMLGYAAALLFRGNRALHDIIAGTSVVEPR